ncbi:MAG: hypothetical protein ACAH88_14945 [Roseimicrobium sp.]
MSPTLPMHSGTSLTPDGKEPAVPQALDAAREGDPKPEVRIKRTSRKSRKVWEAAPNGIDHAILLVGLGSVVLVMLFVIIRAVLSSHN